MTELRQKMIEDMKLRGLSEQTQKAYINQIKLYATHYNQSPGKLNEKQLRLYILFLKESRNVANATLMQAIAALRFFYLHTLDRTWKTVAIMRVKKEHKLPIILSKEEIIKVIETTVNIKHKALLATIYSAGLRITEAVRIRIKNIDSKRMLIHIVQSKNRRDRYVILAQKTLKLLREYYIQYRPSPWLFPGQRKGMHLTRRGGLLIFKNCCKKAGIKKHVTVHALRHSFATHLMESNEHRTG